jgi:gliding motility-associated-like protein
VNIPQQSSIKINLGLRIPPQCGSGAEKSNGFANIANISGAARPLSITWYKEGQQAEVSRDTFANNLGEGIYRVVVRDIKGCSSEDTFSLVAPPGINLRLDSVSGIKCSGLVNGFASVTASGGTSNSFGYVWSNNAFGSVNNTLNAGPGWVYAAQQGCKSDTVRFNISLDPPFTIKKSVLNPTCRQSLDGKVTLEIEGGAAGSQYEVIWQNIGRLGFTQDSLPLGNYYFVVRNKSDLNCLVQDSVAISGFGVFSISIDSSLTSLSGCSQNPAGQVGLKVKDGFGPASYFVNGNPITSSIASGLTPGVYEFVGRSAIGCLDTIKNFTFAANQPLRANLKKIDSIPCAGGQTCIGIQDVVGGSGKGYTYAINFGNNTHIDSCVRVFAGKYRIDLYDSERCVYTDSITIGEPPIFTVSLGNDIEHELGLPNPTVTVTPNIGTISSVKWSSPDRVKCLTNACNFVELTNLGDFTLVAEALNQNGCPAKASINVQTVRKENVYVPSIFRPQANGVIDPENAYWNIKTGPGVEKINDLYIYDRWGSVIFSTTNLDTNFLGWDGNRNNVPMPSGVYVYRTNIQFVGLNGEQGPIKTFVGTLTLVR